MEGKPINPKFKLDLNKLNMGGLQEEQRETVSTEATEAKEKPEQTISQEEIIEVSQLTAPLETNFDQQDVDQIFDALISNPNLNDDLKK